MRIFSHIHLFLRHHHLPLTDVTWLLLTTQLLLTASSEEVWIPPRASGQGQARCPTRQESQGDRAHAITPFSALKPLKQPPREGKEYIPWPNISPGPPTPFEVRVSLPALAPERVMKVFPLPPLSWDSIRHCHSASFCPFISAMLKRVHRPLFVGLQLST